MCMPNQRYTRQKFGTLRMLRSARSPLYANLVVVSADPEHRGKPGDAIRVDAGGFLQIQRLPARVTGLNSAGEIVVDLDSDRAAVATAPFPDRVTAASRWSRLPDWRLTLCSPVGRINLIAGGALARR
jgi:hypothetical protein